jgi:D-isomer specific 2-hydroxyacid dehydrogenase, NAD binding domain
VADRSRLELARQEARGRRIGQYRNRGRAHRSCLRHEGDRLEPEPEEKASAAGATLVDKQTLFREADVVTVHLVLSRRTKGLISASEFALIDETDGEICEYITRSDRR